MCNIPDRLLMVTTSYTALRAVTSPAADAWWVAARDSDDVPHAVAALLSGRRRLEVSREEASAVIAWAAGVDGWRDVEPKPLLVYSAERD